MTPEEQILKDTEAILNGCADEISNAQTREHQRIMPHFKKWADNLITEQNRNQSGIHLFVITESEDKHAEADNPLSLTDGVTSEFTPMFTFDDIDEAVHHMMAMPSAVLFNEFRKQNDSRCAVYLRAGMFNVLYGQHKLTVHKQLPNGESLTETADIAVHDKPDEFFGKLKMSQKYRMLSTALMAMYEMGKIAEKNTPETYGVMLKRLSKDFDGDDE